MSMTPDRARAIVQRALGAYLVAGKSYPESLPPDLAPWYCYTADGGHGIVVVLPQVLELFSGDAPEDQVVPAPVRAVLAAGYTVRPDGFIACDLPYDPDLGLVTDPGMDEF